MFLMSVLPYGYPLGIGTTCQVFFWGSGLPRSVAVKISSIFRDRVSIVQT